MIKHNLMVLALAVMGVVTTAVGAENSDIDLGNRTETTAISNAAAKKISSGIRQHFSLTKKTPLKAGSALLAAANATDGSDQTSQMVDAVIECIKVSDSLLSTITNLGGKVVEKSVRFKVVRVKIASDKLEELAEHEDVKIITKWVPPMVNKANVSEGVRAHLADIVHEIGFTGKNIKVGVISDSVYHLEEVQSSEDLPTVHVIDGLSGITDSSTGKGEGTAMLEIVHDVAPDAELYFAAAGGSKAMMAESVLELEKAGCQIIVDDVSYLDEDAFGYDELSRTVEEVSKRGVVYVSSAGNSGHFGSSTRQSTWEGDYVGNSEMVHCFKDGDTYYNKNPVTSVNVSGGYVKFVLQWADDWEKPDSDYDLYLHVYNSSNIETQDPIVSDDRQSTTAGFHPIESICINSQAVANLYQQGGYFKIAIRKISGSDRYLRLDGQRSTFAHTTAGNIYGHAAVESAISVAMSAAPNTGTFSAATPVKGNSSDGPRRMFYNFDGTAITPGNLSSTGGRLVNKPDCTGADEVSCATPGFETFPGTSAAAPHIAAIVALMLEKNPTLTPAQVKEVLFKSTWDIDDTGWDIRSGYGIVNAQLAIANTEAPKQESPTIKASAVVNDDNVRLEWDAVDGATSYSVYRSTSSSKPSSAIRTGLTGTSFQDEGGNAGVEYYYWVAAVGANGEGVSAPVKRYRSVTMSVASSEASFGQAADSGSVVITANTDWTAKKEADKNWLTLTKSSGKTGESVQFSVTDNDGQTDRSCKITVMAGAGTTHSVEKKITVTQSGLSVVGIAISGDSEVWSGGQKQLVCTATYNNNSTAPVAPTWGKSAGSISAQGLFTAPVVSVDQDVTITASYAGKSADPFIIKVKAKPITAAPTNPTAVQASDGKSITLNWTAPAATMNYLIYRNTVNEIPDKAHTNVSNVATFVDKKDVAIGTTYYYWIVAQNPAAEYLPSTVVPFAAVAVSVQLAAPTELTVTAINEGKAIKLDWQYGTQNGITFTISRRDSDDGIWTFNGLVAGATTYSDNEVEDGKTYSYRVVAESSQAGYTASAASAVASLTVRHLKANLVMVKGDDSWPGPVYLGYGSTPRSVFYVGDTSILRRYAYCNDGETSAGAFKIREEVLTAAGASVPGHDYFETTAGAVSPSPTARVISMQNVTMLDGLPVGNYVYRVTLDSQDAVAETNETDNVAEYAFEVVVRPVSVAPTKLAISQAADGKSVTLSWTAGADGMTYSIYRNTENAMPTSALTNITNVTTFTDKKVSIGTRYYYWIVAQDANGEYSPSAPVTFDPISVSVKSAEPTFVVAQAILNSECISLEWEYETEDAVFTIYRSEEPECPEDPLATVNGALSYVDNGTKGRKTYYYWVRARKNIAGYGIGNATAAEPVVAGVTLGMAVDCTSLTFATGGDAPWFVEEEDRYEGPEAIRSGIVTGGQKTWLEVTVPGPGVLSFYSRRNVQKPNSLKIVVDGEITFNGYTTSAWWQDSIEVSGNGSHTIRWQFESSTTTVESDGLWFDYMTWAPNGISNLPDTPNITKITGSLYQSTERVAITWDKVKNADYYEVYRNETSDRASATQLVTNYLETEYADEAAEPGVWYYYWVVARNDYGHADDRALGRRSVAVTTSITSISVDENAAKGSFTIEANTFWTNTVSDSWIVLDTLSGEAGERTVNYSILANETGAKRTGAITISAGRTGSPSATIAVTQSTDAPPPKFTGSMSLSATLNAAGTGVVVTGRIANDSSATLKVYRGDTADFCNAELVHAFSDSDVHGIDFDGWPTSYWYAFTDSGVAGSTTYYYWLTGVVTDYSESDPVGPAVVTTPKRSDPEPAGTLYVNAASGSDGNDGLSRATALRTLNGAVTKASESNLIVVADGVYAPLTKVKSTVNTDTFTKTYLTGLRFRSENGPTKTIIDGGGTNRCATLGYIGVKISAFGESSYTYDLDGFTLRNGSSSQGGGIYGGTAKNCIISNCVATSNGGGAYGGTLDNCIITGNLSNGNGGGAYGSVLRNCTIVRNASSDGIAGVSGSGGYDVMASGVGNAVCYNCIVYDNVQVKSQQVCNHDADMAVDPDSPFISSGPTATFTTTCTSPLPASGSGNICADPKLDDAFGLQHSSPCINTGIVAYAKCTTDVFGNARVRHGKVDLGAVESPYASTEVPVAEPIPELPDNPTQQDVAAALAGSQDAKLTEHISDAVSYNAYREWAGKVKTSDGSGAAGHETVKGSPRAWLSFALDSDKLIAKDPAQGDLKVDKLESASESGRFNFTVSIEDVEVGSDATAENLKQVFGLEGSTTLNVDDFSASNVDILFGVPENGKVKFTAGPKDTSVGTFFMRVKMNP